MQPCLSYYTISVRCWTNIVRVCTQPVFRKCDFKRAIRTLFNKNTYRLHQDIVLPEQKRGSGVLVEWFDVVLHPHERAVIHATTGLSLLDLIQEVWHMYYSLYFLIIWFKTDYLLCCLTKAGRLDGESCRQWPLWMRCRCTSSSADGSVQKWSAVLTLVYSKAQGPTVKKMVNQYFRYFQDSSKR